MRTLLVTCSLVVIACAGAPAPVATAPPPTSALPSASVAGSASASSLPTPPPPRVVTAIVAAPRWTGFPFGDSFECALYEGGDVGCAHVELGHASADFRPVPLHDAIQLAAGDSFVCALDRAGAVRCLGEDPCMQYANSETPTFAAGAAEAPRALQTAVSIVELGASEGTIVMRGADQRIYVAGLHDPYAKCSGVIAKPVPDVRSFVHLWAHAECSLDDHGLTSCRTLTTNGGAPPKAMKLSGFPAKSVALVAGQSTNEGGPTLCAIGAAGELACGGAKGSFEGAARVGVPPIRDAAIGVSSLRMLTTTGEVYDQSLAKTPLPMRAACPHAASAPTKVKVDEPIAAITTGSCMLTRSGKVVCVRPGCE